MSVIGRLRLEKYLYSRGMWSPDDIEDYMPAGSKEGLCPLCESELFPNDDSDIDYMQTIGYICHNSIIELPTCEDCRYQIGKMETEVENHNNAFPSTRLYCYVSEHTLPEDCLQHYIESPTICVFCNSDVSYDDYRDTLLVPVNDSENSYGGIVHACSRCSDYYGRKPLHHEAEDKCHMCSNIYPITTHEYQVRRDNKTLNMHLCQECYARKISTYPVVRFITSRCPDCGDSSFIDTSLYPNFTKDRLALINMKCSKHMQKGFPKTQTMEELEIYKVPFMEFTRIVIYRLMNNKGFVFSIEDITTDAARELDMDPLINPSFNFKDPENWEIDFLSDPEQDIQDIIVEALIVINDKDLLNELRRSRKPSNHINL